MYAYIYMYVIVNVKLISVQHEAVVTRISHSLLMFCSLNSHAASGTAVRLKAYYGPRCTRAREPRTSTSDARAAEMYHKIMYV